MRTGSAPSTEPPIPASAAPGRFTIGRRGVAVFAVFYLALFIGGHLYFRREHAEIRSQAFRELAAIGELKANQIKQWRKERQADALRAASDPHLIRALRKFWRTPEDPNQVPDLQEHLAYQVGRDEYSALQLFDTNANLLVATKAGPDPNTNTLRLIQAALTNQAAVFSDFFLNREGRFQVDTAATLRDEAGQPLAVLNLRSDASAFLLPLVEAWPMPSGSAETLLVQREGNDAVILNELRRATNLGSAQRQSLNRTNLTAVQAVLGREGSFEGQDYRGAKVLANLRPISGSSWFIVTKEDEDEAMSEEHFRATEVGVILALFVALGITAYVYHQRLLRIWRNLAAARQRQLEAQDTFRTTLYSIGDGVITTDPASLVVEMNPAAEKLTGWMEAEARGKPLGELLPILEEAKQDAVANAVQAALRENQTVKVNDLIAVVARGGTECTIAVSAAPIRDGRGNAIGVVLVLVDQTQQRAAQRALADSEELWRFALEGAGDGVWDWNLSTGEVLFSNRWWDLLGYDASEIGTTIEEWRKRVHPDDLPQAEADLKAHFDHQTASYRNEHRVQCKDGRWKWILDRGKVMRRDAAGQPLRMIGTHQDITARKQAEQDLLHALEQLSLAQRSARAGIWDWQMPANTLTWSPEFFHLFGLDPEKDSATFDVWRRMVHPEDLRITEARITEAIRDHRLLSNEYRIVTPSGQLRWIHALGDTQYAENGEAQRMMGICLDITARKNTETALRQSEQRFRSYFELPLIGIAITSPEKGWLEVNDRLCQILGYSLEQLHGLTWAQLTHPEDLATDVAEFNRVLAGEIQGYALEKRFIRADGSVVPCEIAVRCIRKPGGEVDYFVALVQDISQRKQTETELRDNRELLHRIINSTPSNIFAFDLQHRFTLVNEAMAQFYRRTKQEIIGKTLHDLFPKALADKLLATNHQIIATGLPVSVEETVTDLAGQHPRVMAMVKFPLRDAEGKIIGLAGVATDITERRRMEEVQAFLAQASNWRSDEPFFNTLARYLAQSLRMDFVCIDRLEGDGLNARTVAIWHDGKFEDNLTYALKDTPCGEVVSQAVCCFPASVCKLFPYDQTLSDLRAESYLGVTLFDHAGQPIGLIALISRQPLTNRNLAEATLKLVGGRAASEIERTEAETALRASEERFRTLFDRASEGITLISTAGKLLGLNEAFARMHGRTVAEMQHINLKDLDSPRSFQGVPERMRRLLSEEVLTFEVEHYHQNGQVFPLEVSASLIRVSGERVLLCFHRDITERKRAEALLAARVQLSEYALSHSLDELLTQTLDEAERLTGSTIAFFHFVEADQVTLSLQTWSTNTLQKMCTAEGKGRHLPADEAGVWADALRERRPLIHNDYANLPHRKSLPPSHAPVLRELLLPILRQGQVVAMLGVGNKPTDYGPGDIESLSQLSNLAWDIVVAKRAEEALRTSRAAALNLMEDAIKQRERADAFTTALQESEQRLNLALEGGELATWDWSLQTKRIAFNNRVATMLGFTPEELESHSRSWQGLIHPKDLADVKKAAVRHLRGETPSFESEHRLRTKSGGWIWVLNKGKVLERDATGRALRACGTAQDITNRKRAEQVEAAVFAIARAAISTLTLDELYPQIHAALQTLLPAQCFYIALFDRQKHQLSFPYFQDPFDVPTPPGKPGRGLTEYVLRTRQPLLATQEITAELVRRGEVEMVGVDSVEWLGVPLIVGQEAIGVMTVQSYEATTHFNTRDLEVMTYVSTQVASAIGRKQAAENLQRNHEEYCQAIESADAIPYRKDYRSTGYVFMGERIQAITGYAPEDFCAALWQEIILETVFLGESAGLTRAEAFQRALTGQLKTWRADHRIRTKSGAIRWISDASVLLFDAQGSYTGSMGLLQDISERKAAELALAETTRFAHATIDALTAHLCVLDSSGTILAINRAWERFAAANPPPARKVNVGDNYLEVCRAATGAEAAEAATFQDGLLAVLRNEQTLFEFEYPCHAPFEQRWFLARVTRFPEEGPVRVVVAHENITARKLADLALRESAEHHRTLLHTAMDGFWMVDLEGRLEEVNETYCRMSGYTEAELLTMRVTDLEAVTDLEVIAARIQNLVTRGEDRFETQHRRKDGSVFDVELSVQYHLASGRMVAFLRDVTTRKQAELALRESEDRYRMLVEDSPDAIGIYQDDKLVFCNRAGARLLGAHHSDELIGRESKQVIHSDDLAVAGDRVRRRLAGELNVYPAEVRYVRLDGTTVQVEVSAAPVIYRGEPGLQFIARDISARKLAETALRESEARFRTLFEVSPVAIALQGADGKVIQANTSYQRMLGYSEAELQQLGVKQITHPEDVAEGRRLYLEIVAAIRDHYQREKRYCRKDGQVIWAVSSVSAIRSSDGKLRFLISTVEDITARRQAEKVTRELASIVEHSADGVVGQTADGIITTWNRSAELIYGYPAAEVLGQPLSLLLPPDQAGDLERAGQRLREGSRVEEFETTGRRKDGKLISVAMTLSPIRNEAGKLTAASTIVRDISARRLAEEHLTNLHQQNELILLSAAEGIMGLDLQGHHTFVNPSAASMLGYTVEELLGRHSHSLWHHTKPDGSPYPESECPILDTCQNGALHRVSSEVFWRNDGTSFPVEYAARPIYEQGRVAGAVVSFTDITARRRAEALIRLESAALEAAANAIIITDSAGQIEWVNGAFTTLTGYSLEEAVGQNPRLVKSGKQSREFYRNLWATILAGKVWQGELINRRKNGELYHEDVTITPLRNEQGRISHFIAVKQDITARKKLEEQYQQSQKMEAFGQLAGGVAHDFNNLLGVMLGNAELMQLGILNEKQREALQEILDNGERASSLTQQLLSFSRRGVHHARPLDLNEIVSGINKMLHRVIGEDIVLETHLLAGGAPVKADSSGIELVLLNLVVNSRAAMPDGGQLDISITRINLDAASTKHLAARPGDFIRLSVRDSGSGIAPEHLPRIFEPFFTTKEVGKGTGLGLATVHGIIEQHEGWIEVESELGKGTTFHLYLPRRPDAPTPPTVRQELDLIAGGTETILVVEDEPALLRLTSRTLRRLGYRVIEAADGAAALELWPQHQDEVALVLTDVIMPGGVSGGQLAERLLAQKPGLKVMFMSGYPGDVAGRNLTLREDVNFLRKPFNPVKLGKLIRACLDAAAESSPPDKPAEG